MHIFPILTDFLQDKCHFRRFGVRFTAGKDHLCTFLRIPWTGLNRDFGQNKGCWLRHFSFTNSGSEGMGIFYIILDEDWWLDEILGCCIARDLKTHFSESRMPKSAECGDS